MSLEIAGRSTQPADPTDPDKPADVKGTPDVAASDIATAIKYCNIAANSSRRAMYQFGRASADPARARELLSRAAAARGQFEKAAAQNHPGALERMGAFAQQGRGGTKDSDAAKAYYERAAALGDDDARKALERMRCPCDQGQARQRGDEFVLLNGEAAVVRGFNTQTTVT